MASIYKKVVYKKGVKGRAKKYTIKYKNEYGKWVTTPGSHSYDLTQKKAAHIEHEVDCSKRGLVDPFADPKKEPLSDHLQAFTNHLAADENTPEYVKRTMKRITDVFAACGFKTIDDLTRYDARGKVGDCLKALRDSNLSNASSNHYLTAIKNFLNWAAHDGRMPQSPILLLEKLSTATDDRKERRALTADEFAKLIEKARKGPVTHQLTGEQRAWLYMTAAYSGLRASELGSLTSDSFHFVEQPFIRVAAHATKNKQPTDQPIPKDFAKMIRPWVSQQEGRLWSRLACARSAEMLRVDLAKAKIPYETEEGVVDFHALRVTYITNLARSGVHPKVAQLLARHSTMELTMKVYTKLNPTDVSGAVNAIFQGTNRAHTFGSKRNIVKQRETRDATHSKAS